jgi:hypothetical protein
VEESKKKNGQMADFCMFLLLLTPVRLMKGIVQNDNMAWVFFFSFSLKNKTLS